jgi:hypothetical protein
MKRIEDEELPFRLNRRTCPYSFFPEGFCKDRRVFLAIFPDRNGPPVASPFRKPVFHSSSN